MILSGEFVKANEAASIGLVNGVAEPEELEAMVLKVASTLCKRGPVALRFAIDAVLRGGDTSQEEGMLIEADLFSKISETEDMREGMTAFLEKRPPEFRGK
jgi:enoyl-CoA hydratase